MQPAVVARDASKRYGETVALDGVSLSVQRGELFALIGPNGAGKTTLVRCLTGTTAHEGTVELLGEPPGEVDRGRIGLLPQSFAPAERLTARELVGYYATLYDDARDPEQVLSEVGLGATDTRYENLSGGQQRRTCVAAALVNDPDVLFLDEPTIGIDPAGRQAVRNVVADLVETGTTVVLTTHDMAEVERLADRVGVLVDGELAAAGPPGDLIERHGGESALHVRTDSGPAVLADAGFEARGVEDGIVVDGIVPRDIADVVRALDARDVAFDALEWRDPGLEDVYLALAGDRETGDRFDRVRGPASRNPEGDRA